MCSEWYCTPQKEVWLDWVSKWRMQHQRLMPTGNIELFNQLFLPSAVIAVINIKLKCFLRKYGSSQSDLLIVWFTALHNLRAHLDINLLNRVTMIENCIFASMKRYTVRYDYLNNHQSMGPHKLTFQVNLKHRRNRQNSDWFCVV